MQEDHGRDQVPPIPAELIEIRCAQCDTRVLDGYGEAEGWWLARLSAANIFCHPDCVQDWLATHVETVLHALRLQPVRITGSGDGIAQEGIA